MATRYRITLGDEIIEFEGPDDLSDSEIEQLGADYLKTAKPGQSIPRPQYAGHVSADPSVESSAGGSYLRGAEHGGYFNWDDEIAAAGNAAIPGLAALDNWLLGTEQRGPFSGDNSSFWDRFQANMNEAQQQREADEAQHPTASTLGNVTGGLSLIGPSAAIKLPGVVTAATNARPILAATAIGTGAGAVSGAGAGRGNRGQSAALGGLAGGALGGAVGGGIVSAPIVGQYAKVLLGQGQSVTREAVQQITRALQRDGYDVASPAGVQKLKDALQEFSGKPVSLADIGSATRARAGVGLRSPSAQQQVGADTVMTRQAGQPQRLAKDIRETVAPRTDVHAIDDDLVAQRAQEAERLRDKALYEDAPKPVYTLEQEYQRYIEGAKANNQTPISFEQFQQEASQVADMHPLRVEAWANDPTAIQAGGRQSRTVNDPRLQQLARLPLAQRALTGALEQSEAERALLATMGRDISHLPDLNRGSQLDMRSFDYLKRYLDDEVNNLYRRGQGRTFSAAEANQVKELRNAIRERLRMTNPEYANYLDAYQGSSEMIDALRSGREFAALDPEQIAAEQAGRSTAGQELYRVGAARGLLDRVQSARGETSVPANRILNSPEEMEQLQATGVSPENFNLLNTRVRQERQLSLLPRELQGSQTEQRMAARADADAGTPIVPFNPASGFGWAGALIRALGNKVSTARNAAVNEELLPRLLSQDPKVIESTIGELEKAGQVALARQIRRMAAANRSGVVGGTVIGSPVALPAEDY